jgi:DNA-directed RNA polymerase subunit alpha
MGSIEAWLRRALAFLQLRILPSHTQLDEPLANETPVTSESESASSLEELRLTPRVFNCLSRADIHNIETVVSMSEEDLLNIRGLGKQALSELKERLAAHMRP